MKQPSAELLDLFAAAAHLRAGGATWETVGARVGRAASTCRRWPSEYPRVWRRLYREAVDAVVAEAGAEAVTVLRQKLRSDDDKTSLNAAQLLFKNQAGSRDESADGEKGDVECVEFVVYLKGLNDGQLDDLVDELLAARAAPGGDAAGTGRAAGAA